jgi:tetratricopeptide (TPR) repeat protein
MRLPRRFETPDIGLPEAAALAVGIAVFGFLGWDSPLWDARLQLLLHLLAVGTIAALLAFGWRGGLRLPRTPIDLAVLALVGAFALATLTPLNPGLSVRALAAIVAFAAMLPVALIALRLRPVWTALVVVTPVVAIGLGTLIALLARRVEWYAAGGPGLLPPVRLPGEGTPFGSVAVPPFIILGTLPLTLLIDRPDLRRYAQVALVTVGVPITLLSGSRSAWLAIGAAGLVFVAPLVRRVSIPRRWTARRVGLALLGVLGAVVAVAFVAPRALAVSSLVYRSHLWRDTLAAWSSDPLMGIGPGTMPYARQAAAPALTFPVRQPHSHDLPLGLLGDAGLIGLAAGAVLVVLFVVVTGPWRTRSLPGRAAFAVLAGFGVAGLFEDLTFLPNFNLIVILLAAIALTDAGAVTWHRLSLPRPIVLAGGLAAVGLVAAMVFSDAAALAYRSGIGAASRRDWPESTAWLMRSVQLDPWHPAGPKSLTVSAEMTDRFELARVAAEKAVELNPGDAPSWTNLARLCRELEDQECMRDAADRAVATAELFERQLINSAFIYDELGLPDEADHAFRLSLLTNLFTGLDIGWPRDVPLDQAQLPELDATSAELHLLIGRAVMDDPIEPDDYEVAIVRALAFAIRDDRDAAVEALAAAERETPDSPVTWDITAALQRYWGVDSSRALAVGEVIRGGPLDDEPPRVGRLTFDIASFRAYPRDGLVSSAHRLLTDEPWPWALEELLP